MSCVQLYVRRLLKK